MKGLNKAYFIGRIGQEPEIRQGASGASYMKLPFVTPHTRKVGDEWVETPDWHRLTVFGRDAEFLSKYAHKGDGLAVECAVRQSKWTDKDNTTRYDTSLIVERVLWLQSRTRATAEAPPPADTDAAELPPPPEATVVQVAMEEVPF